ncbi:MAG: EAL domain-containing protein [Micromonosporaceae bacterium]|nr:EAL domain-containing protein [Micromonosporaceae bacterium]
MFSDASTISTDLDAMTEVTALIEARAVTCVLQPIVRLSSGEIVAYEALARGPLGTRWESPVELFRAARVIGRGAELDWLCRARAVEAAAAAHLPKPVALFINTEPGTVGVPCPADLAPTLARVGGRVRIVHELTERAVAHEPATMVAAAAASRRAGCGVGLDNVGGDPAVLALMALIRPDVVKLDPYLLRSSLEPQTVALVEAVNDYARATGAVIAAAGIETEQHRHIARALGATVGQGWLLGHPGQLMDRPACPRDPLPGVRPLGLGTTPLAHLVGRSGPVTPFDLVAARRPIARASAGMLLPIARRLESAALDCTAPVVLLSCLAQPGDLTPDQRAWYATLASRAALVGVTGRRLTPCREPGLVVAGTAEPDRLAEEWNIIVIGANVAGALVARRSGPRRGGPERAGAGAGNGAGAGSGVGAGSVGDRLEYAVTYDRDLVLAAARAVLDRMTA